MRGSSPSLPKAGAIVLKLSGDEIGDGPGPEGLIGQGHFIEHVASSSDWHQDQAGGDGAGNLIPRKRHEARLLQLS